MFKFLSRLFSVDPIKKEQRRIERIERDRLRAERKHKQRIERKQILTDNWHSITFPYQVTIFNIQRANKGYGSTCQISVRYIENGKYKDMIYLINPKSTSFSFSNYHDITQEDVADAPTFKEVWPYLETYFAGKNVVTYYADAHLRALRTTLKRNHISEPDMHFIDLYDYFCDHHASWKSLSLEYVSEKLNLASGPSPKYSQDTLWTITDILTLMYEKRPGILRKLLGIKVRRKNKKPNN